jgi:mannobiose 2-epimerase
MGTDLLKLRTELESELQNNILGYWRANTIDEKHGGFIGSINHNNVPNAEAPKGAVMNARILWTFASAYRINRNEDDLKMAQRAYQYILDNFIDKTYGGVYWELDFMGNPSNTRNQIYGLAFVIYGMVEYYKACGDKNALASAVDLFYLIEKHSFDKDKNGYFEALTCEWNKMDDYRLSEKDDNESKTMNTHLHILEAYTNLYREWENDKLKGALSNLIKLFTDKFINQNYNLILFFDDDWTAKSDMISYGHDIECSWLLHEAAEVLGDSALTKKVANIAVNMAQAALKGIDADGGLIYETFPSKNHTDTDKHWWPQAEAIVGFYNAYQLSGNETYLQNSLNSWSFIKKYIVDKDNGEWYWSVNKDRVPYTENDKAGFWKCPYHNGRACMELIERLS